MGERPEAGRTLEEWVGDDKGQNKAIANGVRRRDN